MYIQNMKFWNTFHRYSSVLIAQLFIIALAFTSKGNPLLSAIFSVSLILIFGSIIITIWTRKLPRYLAIISGAIGILSSLALNYPGLSESATLDIALFVCISFGCFIFISIIAIGKSVFITDRVTLNQIIGSICLYLLIGMFFTFLLTSLEIFDSTAFLSSDSSFLDASTIFGNLMYFSYSTLTTTGYGDIVPNIPLAKLFSSIESMVGSMYIAIVIARLVGMHINQTRTKK